MKRKITAICFTVACAVGLSLSAQTPQTATETKGKTLTLTGCLQTGTEPNTFVLNNVTPGGKETTSTPGAKPDELAKTEPSYILSPDAKVSLKEHVGHKIEVTGTLAAKSTSSPPASQEKKSTPEYGSAAAKPQLKVTSMRHISESCP